MKTGHTITIGVGCLIDALIAIPDRCILKAAAKRWANDRDFRGNCLGETTSPQVILSSVRFPRNHYLLFINPCNGGSYLLIAGDICLTNAARNVSTDLGVAYAKTGRRKEALAILENLKKSKSSSRLYRMSYIHVALGDFDSAFANLEKGVELQDDRLTRLKYDEFFESLHSDARFRKLLKKMNLPV